MITSRLLALAMLLAAPGLVFFPGDGAAQGKKPPLSIAVVDVNKLLRESKAMKGVRDQAEKIEKDFKADYLDEAKRLQAEEQELRKKQPVLTGREFEQQRQDLASKFVNLRRKREAQSRLLQESFQNSLQRFREEIVIVVKALAVEDGYTIVLNAATAIHVTPQYDVTDTVLARLDKRLPTLKFEVEGVTDKKKAPANNKKK